MPLTTLQITELAKAFHEEWDLPTLTLFASRLDVNLINIAPDGSLKERAIKFIIYLRDFLPPRDNELLEKLRVDGNARLKAIANAMLTPWYFPTGDPHDAIVLGRIAFVNRTDLRQVLRDFTNPSHHTTHVLIVRGDQPGGKSYSWEFIRHLAASSVGAVTQRLRLANTSYTPREILEQIAYLLQLDPSGIPPMKDEPQLARIDPLINWFKGKMVMLQRPYWLVIDDLNDPSVTPDMRETVYALAYSVEEGKPPNLWIALLGYNTTISEPDLRYIAQEEARFPDVSSIAEHFECMAKASPQPLPAQRAREMAEALLMKFPKLDKEGMSNLKVWVERMGEKLKLGQQP